MILPDVTVLHLFLVYKEESVCRGIPPSVCVHEGSAIIFEEGAGILQSSGRKLSFQFSGPESCLCNLGNQGMLGNVHFFSVSFLFIEARVIPEGGKNHILKKTARFTFGCAITVCNLDRLLPHFQTLSEMGLQLH